jgi:hypothetical protein
MTPDLYGEPPFFGFQIAYEYQGYEIEDNEPSIDETLYV